MWSQTTKYTPLPNCSLLLEFQKENNDNIPPRLCVCLVYLHPCPTFFIFISNVSPQNVLLSLLNSFHLWITWAYWIGRVKCFHNHTNNNAPQPTTTTTALSFNSFYSFYSLSVNLTTQLNFDCLFIEPCVVLPIFFYFGQVKIALGVFSLSCVDIWTCLLHSLMMYLSIICVKASSPYSVLLNDWCLCYQSPLQARTTHCQ